ncbi:hypothetical protein [Chryseobacterium polytrichastri]|uniref:Uncharacterized protein n=1 Tax=Chryseobacterium polytrichastri TaxID=1302687 RepID=A0A1M6SY61_9FLAO|nr:hypothetical protein [Chryseobacterium polytrichastri]SHK49633.1 hypothetical protein SAMN05444267_1004165 [Chryseobacterium polytrichastri]
MKKFVSICFFSSFILGFAQQKKISFVKEFDYQQVEKKSVSEGIKIYASKSNEFLSKIIVNSSPAYFFTDILGTSSVNLDARNYLASSDSDLSDFDKNGYTFSAKKLTTKENILGIPCTHYLINYMADDKTPTQNLKVCIDEKSTYNNINILNGLLARYLGIAEIKNANLKGFILKAGLENKYDTEYFVLSSIQDTKDVVFFDHKKAIADLQKKQDSIKRTQKEVYIEKQLPNDSVKAPMYGYYNNYYVPEYISEYKKSVINKENLAINNISSELMWKGLPNHCRNIDKNLPEFKNSELKGHLKNYVGQVCDMYLKRSPNSSVNVKETLDQIRYEVLYFNEIQGKLDQADQKKLNNYLQNLD